MRRFSMFRKINKIKLLKIAAILIDLLPEALLGWFGLTDDVAAVCLLIKLLLEK